MRGISLSRLFRLGGASLALVVFAAVFAASGPAAAGTTYAALGDSYSSGVGHRAATRSTARASEACTPTRICGRRGTQARRSRSSHAQERRPPTCSRSQIQAVTSVDDARDHDDRRERHRLCEPHLPVHALGLLGRARQRPREPRGDARRGARSGLRDSASRAQRSARRSSLSATRGSSRGRAVFGTLGISSTEETKANATLGRTRRAHRDTRS